MQRSDNRYVDYFKTPEIIEDICSYAGLCLQDKFTAKTVPFVVKFIVHSPYNKTLHTAVMYSYRKYRRLDLLPACNYCYAAETTLPAIRRTIMSKKLFFLTSFVLVLALVGTNVVFGGIVWEGRVNKGSDDAEEHGAWDLGVMEKGTSSSDLEMPYGDSGKGEEQIIGIRFTNVGVPPGAIVANAYVEFTCDETKDGTLPVSLIIEGELSPNATTFAGDKFNITSRTRTTAKAIWEPRNWTTVGGKDQTSNIAVVIQQIVSQRGWASGNALVLIIRNNPANPSQGIRCVESYNGEPGNAPLLHIEFTSEHAVWH